MRARRVSARVAVTAACETTAPVASSRVPRMLPVISCAGARVPEEIAITTRHTRTLRFLMRSHLSLDNDSLTLDAERDRLRPTNVYGRSKERPAKVPLGRL